MQEALKEAVGDAKWENSNPDDLWREDGELRKAVSPVLADLGETAQFLAFKKIALTKQAWADFLYWLYDDLAAALSRVKRSIEGDYRHDEYAERFPKFIGADNGKTPQQLFDAWVSEKKPARATVESWQYVFAAMTAHFTNRSAASINSEEADQWTKSLITPQRSGHTVKKTYLTASKTIFGWATEHKRISGNPFATVMILRCLYRSALAKS